MLNHDFGSLTDLVQRKAPIVPGYRFGLRPHDLDTRDSLHLRIDHPTRHRRRVHLDTDGALVPSRLHHVSIQLMLDDERRILGNELEHERSGFVRPRRCHLCPVSVNDHDLGAIHRLARNCIADTAEDQYAG